jgi:hypothetical protein
MKRIVGLTILSFAILAFGFTSISRTQSPWQQAIALIRNADDPGRVPYQTSVFSTTAQPDPELPIVPAGKRLVIQNISAKVFTPGTPLGMLKLQIFPGPNVQEFRFPMTFAGTEAPLPGNLWVGNFPTTVFIDSGKNGQFIMEAPSLNPNIAATVSGYLLDCSATAPCAPIAP